MSIENITEIPNNSFPNIQPVKEIMDYYIPDINVEGIPKYNGFIWLVSGSGGSGKSSMILNFFRKNSLYRGKFDNIYYFCPSSSFESVSNHPFKTNSENINIHHELTHEILEAIYNDLEAKKLRYTKYLEKQKEKRITKKKGNKLNVFLEETNDEDDDEEVDLEYSCLFIDDMADLFKSKSLQPILNKILIKTRHLCLAVIISTQQLKYFPLRLRSQLTNITIFKPKNMKEWNDIAREYFNMNAEDALKIYNYVFDKPFTHLDVDTKANIYYKNFNQLQFS